MITALNFTDFLYRPRRPEELDTASGGGVLFSQAAHQVDIVRLLGGGPREERARHDRRMGSAPPHRRRVLRRSSRSRTARSLPSPTAATAISIPTSSAAGSARPAAQKDASGYGSARRALLE